MRINSLALWDEIKDTTDKANAPLGYENLPRPVSSHFMSMREIRT